MINFSGIPVNSILGRAFRYPLRLIPDGLVVPILQGPLRGKQWIVGSSTHGCWLGSYECEKQREFVKAVSPGAVVYDVGANVGFYTLLASKVVGSEGHVIAFEPVPRNLSYLRDHLILNRCANVTVVGAAVLEKESRVLIDESLNSSMSRVSDSGRLEVSSVSLDELFLSGRIPKADVIKMDIEGSEYRALCGARRLLTECHPIIFLSTHGPDVHRHCCALLQSLGYRLDGIGGEGFLYMDELLCVA